MMNKMLFVMLLLVLTTMISGCVSQPATTIKSQEEVTEAVTDISKDVENIGSKLEDMEKSFG
jgi:PBP1b-binding outer membrane lipoprotein LpoB